MQSYFYTREAAAYDAAPKAPLACEHWSPRGRRVGASEVLTYRLGRDAAYPGGPFAIKRWGGRDAREDALLDCLATGDAAAAPAADSRALARTTLRCVDAPGGLRGALLRRHNLTGAMTAERRRAGFSVLGDADPWPDAAALFAAVDRYAGGDS